MERIEPEQHSQRKNIIFKRCINQAEKSFCCTFRVHVEIKAETNMHSIGPVGCDEYTRMITTTLGTNGIIAHKITNTDRMVTRGDRETSIRFSAPDCAEYSEIHVEINPRLFTT